ncbi:hypothetical protein TRFO_00918 [Tritrichomonas foetus]|uniref:Adenylate and Guanylate cyclase catalytic domain containing protein n=1 Tax=Tritrichomonas foetus TaxID=1144522 RepID=A0A1J4L2G8_9EUKA|nr:hypothetical protein TRFO_00918 [Tritrichomonas foetus]|eukprot:OHT17643.1 hypothetical protein TRFO_00918 [Tritrichomonas foetus]
MSSIMSGTTTSFDDEQAAMHRRENTIFPLYSEMSQVVKMSSAFYIISQTISLVQFITSGMWQNAKRYNNFYTHIKYFKYFVDAGLNVFELAESITSYIILIFVFVFFALWHVFVFAYYYGYHQHTKWMLYITRFMQLVLLAPLLPCYATHAGVAFAHLAEEALSEEGVSLKYTLLFIIMVVASIVLYFLFAVSYSFSCLSPVLLQALIAAWDPAVIKIMMMLIMYNCFMGPVLDLFEPWVNIIFILFSMGVIVYAIFQLRYFPFLHFWVNSVFAGVSAGHFFLELLIIPISFGVGMPQKSYLPVVCVLIVLCIVVSFIYLNKAKKKIINSLSYSAFESEKITDALKRQHFESLNIKTVHDIHSYLRIGISYHCDLFIDFSFSRFVIDNYPTKEVVFANAHMISFFPSELQYFAYCLGLIHKYGKLTNYQHFLLFQLKKVHLMRQSSLSKEAVSTIRKIRKKSLDGISAIRGFWKEISNETVKVDSAALIAVNSTTSKIKGEFQDLTEKFSNNQEMCNEYANFLIEGSGDFFEAVKWRIKARKLEMGCRIDTDYALRSLLNAYPHYLFDKIIDTRGVFLKGKEETKGTTSTNSSNHSSEISNQNLIDQKIEDITSEYIKDAKMRISIERALSVTNLPGLNNSKLIFLAQMLFAVLIFIIVLIALPTFDQGVSTIIHELEQINSVYTCIDFTAFLSNFLSTLHPKFKSFGGFEVVHKITGFPEEEVINREKNVFKNPHLMLADYIRSGINSMNSLMTSLVEHPIERIVIYSLLITDPFEMLFSDKLIFYPHLRIQMTRRSSLFNCFYLMHQAVSNYVYEDYDNFETLDLLATGAYNMIHHVPAVEQMQEQIAEIGTEFAHRKQYIFDIMKYLLPVVYGVFFLPIQIRAMILLYKRTKSFIQLLTKVKPETIEASLTPIAVGSKEKKINTNSSQLQTKRSMAIIFLPGFTVIVVIVNAIMCSIPFVLGSKEVRIISSLFQWYKLASFRLGAILQCITCITHLSFHESLEYRVFLNQSFSDLKERHLALLGGSPTVPRLIGFDESVDTRHFIDSCEDIPDAYYKYYLCLSTDRSIDQMMIMLQKMIDSLDNMTTFTLNCDYFCNIIILLDFKLTNLLFDFHDSISKYSKVQFANITAKMQICCIVGLILSVFLTILEFTLISVFDNTLKGLRQLIRLLPPNLVMKNKELVNLISGTMNNTNEHLLTTAQSIILASSNASISVSLDLFINSVNAAFRTITGFAPDEVLGQSLEMLFPFSHGSSSSSDENSNVSKLYEALEQMKNNSSNVSEVLNMKCLNDQGEAIRVQVTAIAIQDEFKNVESFVLILRDMAALKMQEIAVKNEKKRSEKIMENLIPSNVYHILQRNDPEASTLFVSSGGTVIITQIVGLIDCVNSLSPSQMIDIIGKITNAYEEIASRYPAVHTLTGHDDILIACCGVFDFIDQPKDQITQAVMFAMEFHTMTEELNEQNDIALSFRTGINYGGPISGNILNADTPTFDLFGNMIAIASRFATYGDVGCVQISESVKLLLDPQEYIVEKGKKISGKNKEEAELSYIVKDIIVKFST